MRTGSWRGPEQAALQGGGAAERVQEAEGVGAEDRQLPAAQRRAGELAVEGSAGEAGREGEYADEEAEVHQAVQGGGAR